MSTETAALQTGSDEMSTPPPTLTYEQLAEHARSITDGHPKIGRLQVGVLASTLLKTMSVPGERLGPTAAAALYGVPVVVPEGEQALEPTTWRLLDPAGNIIKEGTITP